MKGTVYTYAFFVSVNNYTLDKDPSLTFYFKNTDKAQEYAFNIFLCLVSFLYVAFCYRIKKNEKNKPALVWM